MTVESTANRISHAGNGVTTEFPFPYLFFAPADLKVVEVVDATGAEAVLVLDTDYTVTGAGNEAGGDVVATTAPATGLTWVIIRELALTQGLDLVENDSLPAEAVEQAFDRGVMLAQQNATEIARAARLPEGFTGSFDPALPQPTPRKALVVNAAGDGFEYSEDDLNDVAGSVEANAQAAAASAAASASSAASSANSATDSANSATSAATEAVNSANSATASAGSAAAAATSASNAAGSATASANSATASANSATASANSATDSANSAAASANSATDSANSAAAIAGQLNDLFAGAFFELDGNLDYMPTLSPVSDPFFELDGNGDYQPQA